MENIGLLTVDLGLLQTTHVADRGVTLWKEMAVGALFAHSLNICTRPVYHIDIVRLVGI